MPLFWAVQHRKKFLNGKTAMCPWAILLDPTSACNMHCIGCWAAEYGNRLNLTFDELDSIVTQGKELGTHMYIFTGGEPLVRKKDVIALCEKHSDCEFLSFTNGTLIDEAFCQDMLRVKNFVPAISLEGFSEANDSRRGEGTFEKVKAAMALLKSHKLPFGISTCYTSKNYNDICSEEFYDMFTKQVPFLYGSSITCPWAAALCLNFCPHRNNVQKFTIVFGISARANPFLPWISRTMVSM